MTAPKLFISYSWSSPEHEQWVVDLATELRESGVDVILISGISRKVTTLSLSWSKWLRIQR